MIGNQLKISKKELVILVALLLITVVFTAYTISVYYVASHIHEIDGTLMWSSIPGGSFYPWPSYSEIGLPALTPVNEVDGLFYQLFIKSWILVGITVLLWAIMIVFCMVLFLRKVESNLKDIGKTQTAN